MDEKLIYSIDAERQLLYSKWMGHANSLDYRREMLRLYEVIQRHQTKLWLYDASLLNLREVPDQKWVLEYFILLLTQCKPRQVALQYAPGTPPQAGFALRDKTYRIFGKGVQLEFFIDTPAAAAWLVPDAADYQLPPLPHNSLVHSGKGQAATAPL